MVARPAVSSSARRRMSPSSEIALSDSPCCVTAHPRICSGPESYRTDVRYDDHVVAVHDAALRARPVAGAEERVLPVAAVLSPVVTRLRRGITVSVSGATSLALALAAG